MPIPDYLVCLFHGKNSNPGSLKIQRLAAIARNQGFETNIPDHSELQNPDQRVSELLEQRFEAQKALVLLGSSMGGYVATILSTSLKPSGLFLLAPAIQMPGYQIQDPSPKAQHISIIHAWQDQVIPIQNSINFAHTHQASLHCVNGDHRLEDQLPLIETIFSNFLSQIKSDKS